MFRVRPGCSLLLKSGRLVKPGETFDASGMKPHTLNSHLSGGFIEPASRGLSDAPQFPEKPPGTDSRPPVSGQEGQGVNAKTGTAPRPPSISQTNDSGIHTESESVAPEAASPVQHVSSPWTLDPANLADKPLEVLNVMVSDRDPKVTPFETVAEAAAFLSKDFRHPAPAAPVTPSPAPRPTPPGVRDRSDRRRR